MNLKKLCLIVAFLSVGVAFAHDEHSGECTMAAILANPTHVTTQVQSKLKSAGYYRGNVDGKWGPLTMEAVRAYQHDHVEDEDDLEDFDDLTDLMEDAGIEC